MRTSRTWSRWRRTSAVTSTGPRWRRRWPRCWPPSRRPGGASPPASPWDRRLQWQPRPRPAVAKPAAGRSPWPAGTVPASWPPCASTCSPGRCRCTTPRSGWCWRSARIDDAVILQVHHAAFDGISSLALLRAICAAYRDARGPRRRPRRALARRLALMERARSLRRRAQEVPLVGATGAMASAARCAGRARHAERDRCAGRDRCAERARCAGRAGRRAGSLVRRRRGNRVYRGTLPGTVTRIAAAGRNRPASPAMASCWPRFRCRGRPAGPRTAPDGQRPARCRADPHGGPVEHGAMATAAAGSASRCRSTRVTRNSAGRGTGTCRG